MLTSKECINCILFNHVDISAFYCHIYTRRFYYDHRYVSVSRFGRKTAFMLSFILHLGGGFGSAFAPNYGAFVACRFITGMSNMGMFMSTFVIGKPCSFLRTNIHSLVKTKTEKIARRYGLLHCFTDICLQVPYLDQHCI